MVVDDDDDGVARWLEVDSLVGAACREGDGEARGCLGGA